MNNTQENNMVLQIPIEDIIPNRFQPRLSFDEKSMEELASSIKQHGIILPLVLRRLGDKYEIIAGERRYKAAMMAGLVSVPAIIKNMNDFESAEVAVVENVQRKDLTAIEEARSFKSLLDKGYMTQEDLAKKMGLSQAAISNKLRLLNLDQTVQDAVLQEKISERHARSLLKIKNQDEQKKMLQRIIEERLTVRQLEEEIKKMIGNNGQDEEVPIVNGPDLKSMINNAVDITPVKPVASEEQKDLDLAMDNTPNVDIAPVNNGFPSAQSMPNKFFNFLEDEAANMSMEEKPVPIINPVEEKAVDNSKLLSMEDILNNTDGIEMLDDFIIPSVKEDKSVTDNTFLNDIIATIRNLHLDSDKVKVEEINLPTEYKINITIKKDKI